MAFTLGEWEFDGKYPKPDGTFGKLKYHSRVNMTMGGKAFQDNFGQLNADGKMDTLGITVRTYDAKSGKWRMLWYSATLDFITQFEGEYIDGEFRFKGEGVEKGRPFLERVIFYGISEDSYSWKMDKSYDDGETWIENFFSYKAKRVN